METDKKVYTFAKSPVIKNSVCVYADSILYREGIEYQVNHQKAELILLTVPTVSALRIEYLLVPLSLTEPLQEWKEIAYSDTMLTEIKKRTNPILASDARLDIQGTKTFAITFSDESTFDLKQSLFVNISGELAKNVNINARLSDSQSKLSPEGDSKELSSLDNVFIRIYGPKYELAMGDLELKFSGTRYLEYYTKFEGLNAWIKGKHYVQTAYSAGGGKNASIKITIVDGKQGPYYLKANDTQSNFLIIAGSEEIYIDGRHTERGIDYSIDYSEGSVMFKSLVSASNSVIARFQYSNEYYPQSNYLTSSQIELAEHLTLTHHFIWQQDDKKNPLLSEFSPADLDSLNNAGDVYVWGEGVSEVEAGTGEYKRLLNSQNEYYYEYALGDTLACYDVIFSYVGSGQGDYEEFSAGKYRYIGAGMGSWLPRKRLIPPEQKGNLDVELKYENNGFKIGIETLGSINDKNTLSAKDDSDNDAGIFYTYLEVPFSLYALNLNYEQRSEKTFLFGQYRNLDAEYDFASLETADSLAQQESNIQISREQQNWTASLLYRYRNIYDLYSLMALRFISISSGKGLLPAINIRSTISKQDYKQEDDNDGIMQYHQGDLSWALNNLRLHFEALYNLLDNTQFGNSYLKISPGITFGKASSFLTQFSHSNDKTRIKENELWNTTSKTQTYNVKQMVNVGSQRIDLDVTHREIKQPDLISSSKSNYDLITLHSSNSFFKNAIGIYSNYQLNQTEFYPKIRELQYVGSGLGYYDSTGVSVSDGDYDWVYITSSTGSLSSEINCLLNVYLKPGNVSTNDFWQRLQSDTSINLNEQSSQRNNWRSYFFLPGSVYNDDTTIYGRQSIDEVFWLDLMRNKITSNLQISMERTLDKRYQTPERNLSWSQIAQFDFKDIISWNTRLRFGRENSSDTRYLNETNTLSASAMMQKILNPQSNVQAELSYSSEQGKKQDGSENYTLETLALAPAWKSVFMQKYRLTASLGITYNKLSGSDYFAFLPQKRAGWIPSATINGVYRINSFSVITLDYKFYDYPKQDSSHELKLEFKAEI
ncbi:MAG: hypothetical protein ABFC98_01545 [Candidatus Cloacimonas sp.]